MQTEVKAYWKRTHVCIYSVVYAVLYVQSCNEESKQCEWTVEITDWLGTGEIAEGAKQQASDLSIVDAQCACDTLP